MRFCQLFGHTERMYVLLNLSESSSALVALPFPSSPCVWTLRLYSLFTSGCLVEDALRIPALVDSAGFSLSPGLLAHFFESETGISYS